jgi:hypothetical protein
MYQSNLKDLFFQLKQRLLMIGEEFWLGISRANFPLLSIVWWSWMLLIQMFSLLSWRIIQGPSFLFKLIFLLSYYNIISSLLINVWQCSNNIVLTWDLLLVTPTKDNKMLLVTSYYSDNPIRPRSWPQTITPFWARDLETALGLVQERFELKDIRYRTITFWSNSFSFFLS